MSDAFVEVLLNTISDEVMVNGSEVHVNGLGCFSPQEKKARQGRMPKTGEVHTIAARTRLRFIAYRSFREPLEARITRNKQLGD